MSLAEAALWYASRGIPVFPLLPRSKHPREGSHGFKDATCDLEQVRAWWRENPQYNIGIPCGEKSGLLVLDIDPRHGGDAVVEGWIAKYGRWSPSAEVVTGSGGRHVYFKYEPGVRSCTVADGVEIKSDGTYVVASPSIHPDTGRKYSFDGLDGAEALSRLCHAPGWLLRMAREKRPQTSSTAAPGRKIGAGRRNTELTSIAGVLRSRGAGEAELRDLLSRINETLCDPPLRADEVERIAQSVSRYEPRAENERPDAQRIFERLDEGRYRMQIPGIASELEIDLLRREDGNLIGELIARCHLPGNRGVDGLLSIADFNVSSARARSERAKLLAARANTPGEQVDWMGIIEDFSQKILLAEREGSPAVDLADVPARQTDTCITVDGFPVLKHHPGILFGDGGACKSYLALYLAWKLTERGETVLYADWELDAADHRERLESIAGAFRGIKYVRCRLPLREETERLRRIAREEGATYLICDSIALGCDGPPESAEVAMRYFQCLRRIGLGCLLIAHVSKGEDGEKKPFGSAFWHNSARATWFAKRGEQVGSENIVQVALFNRKSNLGPLRPPLGFELRFEAGRTTIRRTDAAEIGEFADKMTVGQRMAHLLKGGAMSVAEIAERLQVEESTIRSTMTRKKGVFLRLPDGRIALADRTGGSDATH
jgi:putative DNA primase/helicase